MPNAHTFEAYRLLREKLGDEATAALLQYIQEVAQTHVATKEDIYKLREELKGDFYKLRDELKGDIAAVRAEMYQIRDELKGDIARIREEMRGELFRVKATLYVVIALVILSNPKVIDTLGRIVDFLK